jgi:transcriptional regulator with XRE-family HTH domain
MEQNFLDETISEIEMNEKIVATKLRGLRVGACIRLDEFAEALGVEVGELASYEDGSENIPASVIAMACALSGTSFDYFFGEESGNIEKTYQSPVRHINTQEEAVILN